MVPNEELKDHRRGPRRARWIAVGAIALFAAILLVLALAKPAPEGAEVGDAAPEFELPLLSGEGTMSSEDLEGRPIVLNFWASYCTACKDEAPVLDAAWRRYRDQGVVVIGVDTSHDSAEAARRFAQAFGMTYPLVKDDGSLADALGINDRFLPQTFYIGAGGELEAVYSGDVITDSSNNVVLGPVTEEGLREQIEQMLADA